MADRRSLQIAAELALPLDAQTQTFGVIAKRGVGKSYLGMVMAEEMICAGLHVVAIDPIGVWWGLRSSKDGKKPGLPVVIIGGEHADVPLDAGSGALIADFVIQNPVPAVIDLSLLRKNEAKHFVRDFAEFLYHKNRNAIHLFLDEADEWAPQRPIKGFEPLLGAMEDLVRRGRARGIGVTMITQRTSVLNKNVLTQIEVLVPMRIVSPQDREAIKDWIEVHGTPEQGKELLASLASLPIGTAWFWSPGWLDLFQRVKVRERTTFDSSATPEAGKQHVAVSIAGAPLGVDALREKLADVVKAHEENDPKILRRRIGELEKQLAQRPEAEPVVERIEVPVIADVDFQRLDESVDAFERINERFIEEITPVYVRLAAAALEMREKLDAVHSGPTSSFATSHDVIKTVVPVQESKGKSVPVRTSSNGASALSKAERLILTVLAQFPTRTPKQIAILAGYAVNGGGFRNALGALNGKGYLSRTTGLLAITSAGLAALGHFDPLPTGRALLNHWLTRLSKAEAASLRAIAEAYPGRISVGAVAKAAGYEPMGGGFRNALCRLRTLELIEGRGDLRASDALFEHPKTLVAR